MNRGYNAYGRFPTGWVGAATSIAEKRAESNSGRATTQDRGAKKNIAGDVIGVLGERIAQWIRPELGVSLKLYESGAVAPKVDSNTGIDIKSSPWGRPRILINAKQARHIRGIVIVIVDTQNSAFWMSETIRGDVVRSWPVFDGPYGDPAHYQYQSEVMRI